MANVSKIFLIPIGLPGMGKTTLSKFLEKSSKNVTLNADNVLRNSQTSQQKLGLKNVEKVLINKNGCEIDQSKISFKFTKISYDKIFTKKMNNYCRIHPQVDMHVAFDIIRGQADQEYLDKITYHCHEDPNMCDSENIGTNVHRQAGVTKEIVYLDRNNTADIWGDIQRTVISAFSKKDSQSYRSAVIVPEQHPTFDFSRFQTSNPICPHMVFECIKRIFGRPAHDCLSSDNKPKVVEVILKFAKLYDGVDFKSDNDLQKYFDDVIRLDFLSYTGLKKRDYLDEQTIETLVQAYNMTPPNFQPPSDQVIDMCIEAVERQMKIHEEQNRQILEEADGPQESDGSKIMMAQPSMQM